MDKSASASLTQRAIYWLFVVVVALFAYSVLVASPIWGALVSLLAGYVVVRAHPRF
jgi:hypothetical protein